MDINITHKKTVAFCTSSMTIRLSRDIYAGVQEACKSLGINIICITGEVLFPDSYETNQAGANIAYSLVNDQVIDGIILYSADIGEFVEDDQLLELCNSFGDIPIVSISREIPGIPSKPNIMVCAQRKRSIPNWSFPSVVPCRASNSEILISYGLREGASVFRPSKLSSARHEICPPKLCMVSTRFCTS